MLSTRVAQILGIKYPIIQGGMAWIADAKLAAAVSNAGGLGLIASMNAGADWVREQIRLARRITDKPFGVNIMLMSPHAAEVAKVVIEEGVPIVTTGAGSPSPYMKDWLNAGIKVCPVVASSGLAVMMERIGASCVIVEGTEAGGHIGELTTMALVPQACDKVSIPVIAAGGIADGRGLAAAFMLGAEGAQIGTRFLVAKECGIHSNYKEKVIRAKDTDTIVTGRRVGHPVRCLKTPFSLDYIKKEKSLDCSDEEIESLGAGALRLAAQEGDEERGCFMAGQSAGLVNKQQTVQEIIDEIILEAVEAFKKAERWTR
ncbi:MAG TPA: nitronate monooxygenase [Clostridia bacterium]|jgi:enoyl-[acyl-carrier protein] reductase II